MKHILFLSELWGRSSRLLTNTAHALSINSERGTVRISHCLLVIVFGIVFSKYPECLYGHIDGVWKGVLNVETTYGVHVNIKKRVVLKKNIPLAKQLTLSNTVYFVRYDFDLTEDLTIPDKCIIYFKGGTINGDFVIKGSSFSMIGNGKYVGRIRRIFSNGVFKCYNCKFIYLPTDSRYFIDCRGSCDIRGNEFFGFKSNVINLEGCMGQCFVTNNFIHDTDLSNAIDDERRAIHILHCGNVSVTNNIIDTYIGCGIGFITSDDTPDIYKSVVVSDNIIKNTRLGGITSMGNSSGNLYNAVIKGNNLSYINNGELKDYSALNAVINIHGGVNCIIEDNTVKDCQGLGLDVEGDQRANNSYVIKNNVFDGCRRLNFNLCDDIDFRGNYVSNIIPNVNKPGAIRIRKTLRFLMQNNKINDNGAETATIQFESNASRPADKVKTFFICKNNIIKVGNSVNYIYNNNCEIITDGNTILHAGKILVDAWMYDTKYPDNFKIIK